MNRWEIAKELNILSLPVIVFHYQNPVEESLHIIKANLQRRHLNEGQRAMLLLEMDSFQQELEQQRQEAKDRQGTRTDLTSVPQGTNVENGKSVDKVAKAKGKAQGCHLRSTRILDVPISHRVTTCASGCAALLRPARQRVLVSSARPVS